MQAPQKILIRRAAAEDTGAIAAVLRDSFIEYEALYTEGGFNATVLDPERIRRRMEEGPVWVAQRDSAVAGTAAAVATAEGFYMRGMAVLPAARGLGIAGGLLKEVENAALAGGYRRLFLSTTPFLSSAIRLYEQSGFRRTEDGVHDLFGTPLFTMEKILKARP
jgi:putative acetyltransferase